jgi:hypothetical protein
MLAALAQENLSTALLWFSRDKAQQGGAKSPIEVRYSAPLLALLVFRFVQPVQEMVLQIINLIWRKPFAPAML